MEGPSWTRTPFLVLRDLRESVTDDGKLRLSYAIELLAEHESTDGLVAKLTELVDRAPRCKSAKKHGFNALFTHACRCKQHAARKSADDASGADASVARDAALTVRELCSNLTSPGPTFSAHHPWSPIILWQADFELAVAHVRCCFEDYLDDHKERALNAAFLEPALFYHHSVGDFMNLNAVRDQCVHHPEPLSQRRANAAKPAAPPPMASRAVLHVL
jgi:hypothetical protein